MRPEDIETAKTIGRNLRRIRTLSGLSQSGLGAHLGVTFQQIQKYENGRNQLSAVALYRLACLFRCDPGVFFDGQGDGAALWPSPRQQRVAGRITHAALAIESAEVQDALLHLIEAVAGPCHDAAR